MAVRQRKRVAPSSAQEVATKHYSSYDRNICDYIVSGNNLLNWIPERTKNITTIVGNIAHEKGFSKGETIIFGNTACRIYEGFDHLIYTNPEIQGRSILSESNEAYIQKDKKIWVVQIPEVYGGHFEAFQHDGHVEPVINIQFSPLEQLVEQAKELKELAFDWDQEGASQIDETVIECGCWFLRHYFNYISKHFGISIQLPEINPCPDGSIDLEWHTSNAQLLINIRKDIEGTYTAYYYGDRLNNKMQVKGSTPVGEFSEHLAVWMKYLI